MATKTQYNPVPHLNEQLLQMGLSKTVYALVTPEIEQSKAITVGNDAMGREDYLDIFREAWTGKQDALHQEFFEVWRDWSSPMVEIDHQAFRFAYPTAGASEALRHIAYDIGQKVNRSMLPPMFHVFRGEYEGYRAMAEAIGAQIMEWDRSDWPLLVERLNGGHMGWSHLVFLSQPSAIDGNIWPECQAFLSAITMPNCVVLDITYVGAVPTGSQRIDLDHPCIRNIVFSLSKPFGAYYDRIGGVLCREEDLGLFGNKWFKNLTSLRLGTVLMRRNGVFAMADRWKPLQARMTHSASETLGVELTPSDVYILATGGPDESPLGDYLRRGEGVRVCLTPGMAKEISA